MYSELNLNKEVMFYPAFKDVPSSAIGLFVRKITQFLD